MIISKDTIKSNPKNSKKVSNIKIIKLKKIITKTEISIRLKQALNLLFNRNHGKMTMKLDG